MEKKEIFDRITKQISDMSVVELQQFIQKINNLWQTGAAENDNKQENNSENHNEQDPDNQLIETLSDLNLKQFNSLIMHIEETLGVKASVSATSDSSDEEGAKKAQEKSHYQVSIANFKQTLAQKIQFIQLLKKQHASLDLTGAVKVFALIEKGEHYIISERATKDEAMEMKNVLDPYVDVILK
jgi:ribosomal protein L7/L12